MTKHYVYKGYGITNENGVAHLDHDANGDPINHSYTGVGAGKIDFVASLDDLSDVTIDVNPSTINDTTAGVSHSISATVMDDGSAVQNKSVVFELYKVSDGSLVETLTGVTNSSGVVTVSYLGVGAGSLYIKVRMFQSKICEVLDALFYEDGTTGTPNPNWVKNGGNFDVTPSTDGILIFNTFTWQVYYRANIGDTSTTQDYTIPVCVEFDYIEASDNSKWYLQFDDGSDRSIRGDVIQATNDCHVTIKATSTDTFIKVDNGTERALGYVVSSPTGIGFRLIGGASLKFKNFKIYPI